MAPLHAFPKSAVRREPLHNARLGIRAAGLASSSTVEMSGSFLIVEMCTAIAEHFSGRRPFGKK